MGKLAYRVPESRKVRYIVHTDCKNEADDQFTLAHCLLTPMLDIKGIIAGHFDSCYGRFPAGTTAGESYEEILRVMDAMDMTGMNPVKCGSGIPLPDEETPVDSEGSTADHPGGSERGQKTSLYRPSGSCDRPGQCHPDGTWGSVTG